MSETVFTIGEQQFNVVKKGKAQAQQVADLGRWLACYGTPTFRSLQDEGGLENVGGLEAVGAVLGTLSGESLLELFSLVFGCPKEVTEAEFDFALLLDGIISLYENQPTIKRVVARFFSNSKSDGTAPASSTPSALPTDGQTA